AESNLVRRPEYDLSNGRTHGLGRVMGRRRDAHGGGTGAGERGGRGRVGSKNPSQRPRDRREKASRRESGQDRS
ncbi:hypothetical protein IscW_ISCW014498, partial [Ixodes scapularis]